MYERKKYLSYNHWLEQMNLWLKPWIILQGNIGISGKKIMRGESVSPRILAFISLKLVELESASAEDQKLHHEKYHGKNSIQLRKN